MACYGGGKYLLAKVLTTALVLSIKPMNDIYQSVPKTNYRLTIPLNMVYVHTYMYNAQLPVQVVPRCRM